MLPALTAGERAFWVWHRTSPLPQEEAMALRAQGVQTLFWNIGEMRMREGLWEWKEAALKSPGLAPSLHVVPVVRLATGASDPFSDAALPGLIVALKQVATSKGELQIDFDCPDRQLAQYADTLQQLRRAMPRVSITALAHWSHRAEWPLLQDAVSEMVPMFYDLQADPTGVSASELPPPLLDPAQVAPLLREWSRCAIPWRAGLPVFARLTVFDSAGGSRGQIPSWSWDRVAFHRELHALAPTHLGATLFRSKAATRVAATPIDAGEMIAARFVDRTALTRAVILAEEAGAAGVVFFRLPDAGIPSGRSLRDLGSIDREQPPRLRLRWRGGEKLELVNDSAADLEPRLTGPRHERDRGYALELEAPGPVWREALAGDFWRVASHADADTKASRPVAVPLATRLTFWFSELRAGASRQTGLLQLAPGTDLTRLRYRVLPLEETWQSFHEP